MPDDTPTPAPALTDEQIDNMAATFRDTYALTLPPFAHPTGKDLFDRWLAAVVARAKREAAEEIAQAIERESATLDHLPPTGDPGVADYRMGLGHGMAGSAEHDLIGAAGIARRIGATR